MNHGEPYLFGNSSTDVAWLLLCIPSTFRAPSFLPPHSHLTLSLSHSHSLTHSRTHARTHSLTHSLSLFFFLPLSWQSTFNILLHMSAHHLHSSAVSPHPSAFDSTLLINKKASHVLSDPFSQVHRQADAPSMCLASIQPRKVPIIFQQQTTDFKVWFSRALGAVLVQHCFRLQTLQQTLLSRSAKNPITAMATAVMLQPITRYDFLHRHRSPTSPHPTATNHDGCSSELMVDPGYRRILAG